MYDEILLPTDGSDGMEPVIDHAESLAAEHDGTLHALYAVNTSSLADLPVESSWENVNKALTQEGEAALEQIETQVDSIPVETTLVEGTPATEIVEYADTEGCDVIVMGTHGRSGVNRLLLGSVAERVVRSSPVPVLTVPVSEPES